MQGKNFLSKRKAIYWLLDDLLMKEHILTGGEERSDGAEQIKKIHTDEREIVGGILSRFKEIPQSVRRGILLFMAGTVLAPVAASGEESWKKHFGYQGWEAHFGVGEKVGESSKGTGTSLEQQIKAAALQERQRIQKVDELYRQKLHQIRLTHIDLAARDHAIRQLDEWRQNEYLRAWLQREVEVHAAKARHQQYGK